MSDATYCPYCECDSFHRDAIRADVQVSDEYGYWYNKCYACNKWSLYDDVQGKQHPIENPDEQPEEGNLGVRY